MALRRLGDQRLSFGSWQRSAVGFHQSRQRRDEIVLAGFDPGLLEKSVLLLLERFLLLLERGLKLWPVRFWRRRTPGKAKEGQQDGER
ncbi:MAG: hypothetical protein ACRD4G_19935, partial [Bryobacteraceae bacterium]